MTTLESHFNEAHETRSLLLKIAHAHCILIINYSIMKNTKIQLVWK